MSRGPTINCAVAFSISSMTCGTSPPAVVPNAYAA
jgi:hypothetical protein